jgi:hypothetical protein
MSGLRLGEPDQEGLEQDFEQQLSDTGPAAHDCTSEPVVVPALRI